MILHHTHQSSIFVTTAFCSQNILYCFIASSPTVTQKYQTQVDNKMLVGTECTKSKPFTLIKISPTEGRGLRRKKCGAAEIYGGGG